MSRITVHEDIFMLCPGRAPLRTARRVRCALWAGRPLRNVWAARPQPPTSSSSSPTRLCSMPWPPRSTPGEVLRFERAATSRFSLASAAAPHRTHGRRSTAAALAVFTLHGRQRAPSLLRCARRRGAGQSAVECANHLQSHILGCQQRVGGGDGFLQQGDQVSFSASRLFVPTDELLLQLGHLEGVELLRQRQRCYWHLSRRLARRRARLGLILHAAAIALVILNGIAAGAPSRPLPHPDLRVLPHRLRALALGRHRLRREAPQGPW